MAAYVQVQLTKAQARAIMDVYDLATANGYDDLSQWFEDATIGAAENGAARIRKALANHEAKAAA